MKTKREVKVNKDTELSKMRHSCEHVLTQAVLSLYPKVLMAMGPFTEEGFYFDFDPQGIKISEEDFPKIEKEMENIVKENLPITRTFVSPEEAKKIFINNPYKLEWINEIEKKGEKVSIYKTGNKFIDLCSGPHIKSTAKIGPYKLLKIAGAYWHGDEKNKMLTRIYGTCFSTKEELSEYLKNQEEAKEKDHRAIGKKLDLFVFSDLVGKGLPLFTEKGSIIRRELERFIVDEEVKRGYSHVYTPELARVDLYKKSGHYPYYKDTMYPVMKVDDEELILRPMTCPHHFQLYASRPRSYKELPVRFAELAKQFRYEKSGELTGLSRVRLFCLADAHIIAKPEQAEEEINQVLNLIEDVATALGLKKENDYHYRLSLGDRNDNKKYYQDDKNWDFAENILRKLLKKRKAPFYEAKGEAAFYGPKIDVQMKNNLGKDKTAFTVQYDFVMPKRFALKYIDSDGKEKEPVVIHRSSIGAFERVLAFLIEHYKGAFPVWLSPVQVEVIPISERHKNYGREIQKNLKAENVRAELNDKEETLGAKIRDAELNKVPYMLIVGDRELKNKKISLRERSGKDLGQMDLIDFITRIKKDIAEKSNL